MPDANRLNTDPYKLMGLRNAAAYMGVSYEQVRKWVKDGEIKPTRYHIYGQRMWFDRAELKAAWDRLVMKRG